MPSADAPLAILQPPKRSALADDARQVLKMALRRVKRVLKSDRADDDPAVMKATKLALSPAVVAVAGLGERSDDERALSLLRLIGEGTLTAINVSAPPALEAGAESPLDSPLASLLGDVAVQGKPSVPSTPDPLVSSADLEAARLRLPFAPPAPSPSPSLLPSAPGSASPGQGGGGDEGGGGGGEK